MLREGEVYTVIQVPEDQQIIRHTGPDRAPISVIVRGRLEFIETGSYLTLRPWRIVHSMTVFGELDARGHTIPWHRISGITHEPGVDPASLEERNER